MLSTIPRFYTEGCGDMDRSRNWQQSLYYYDDRTNPLQLSYAEGRSMRSAPVARPDRLLPDTTDQDQLSNNSSRRRIAVACSRCRKRKIKCSGDIGNGLGCQNCRSAGVDSCNFFRVGSLEVNMNQHVASVSSNYISPANSDRLQYLSAQHAYHYAQHPPLSLQTRNLPVTTYYSNDMPYDSETQGDNYMLSPATPIPPNESYTGYSMHDNARSWSVPSNRYAPPCYSRYGAHDGLSYSYDPVLSSRRPSMVDGPGSPFSISALQMSLPNTGRELPPPTTGTRIQIQAPAYEVAQMRNGISTNTSSNIPQPVYTKAAQHWTTGQTTAGTRNDSVTSSRTGDIAAPVPQKPLIASSTTSEGSIVTLTSSSNASPDISPTTMATTDRTTTEGSLPHHGTLVPGNSIYSLPAASASDTRLSGPGGIFNTFSIARRQHSSGELQSGSDERQISTSYVPLSYPPEISNRGPSIDSFRHNSTETRASGSSHRTSMPTISQDS